MGSFQATSGLWVVRGGRSGDTIHRPTLPKCQLQVLGATSNQENDRSTKVGMGVTRQGSAVLPGVLDSPGPLSTARLHVCAGEPDPVRVPVPPVYGTEVTHHLTCSEGTAAVQSGHLHWPCACPLEMRPFY